MSKVAVLGEGAWGTAIAQVLADNGYAVALWCHDATVCDTIRHHHVNDRYMPQCTLPTAIYATTCLTEALADVEWVFVATPVSFLREVLTACVPWYSGVQHWVLLCKGIENDTLQLPVAIAREIFAVNGSFVVLAGPSFAREVIDRKLTGVIVAADDRTCAQQAACMVNNQYLRAVVCDDIVGVQCGGAFKNAMAVLLGIAQGAEWADNTRALLLTYGWQEMIVLAGSLGAQRDTLLGLAGIGDLFLTLTGHHSKNFVVGCRIGSGVALQIIVQEMGYVPEGVNTIKTLRQLARQRSLALPLFAQVYAVVYQAQAPTILLPTIAQSVACANR